MIPTTFSVQRNSVQETLETVRQVHSESQEMRRMVTALACFTQRMEEIQSTGSAVTTFLNNFPHHTLQLSSDLPSVPDSPHSSIVEMNTHPRSGVQLQLQKTYKVAHCYPSCPCECHRTSYSWSNRSLAKIAGRVFLENKGSSWFRTLRHTQSCKASAVSQTRVIYFIPTWMAMKAIRIQYTSSPLYGPEWLIRIPRLVKFSDHRAFPIISTGNLSEFKSAIARGEFTPYDIYEFGRSLLWVSRFANALQRQ